MVVGVLRSHLLNSCKTYQLSEMENSCYKEIVHEEEWVKAPGEIQFRRGLDLKMRSKKNKATKGLRLPFLNKSWPPFKLRRDQVLH